MDRGSCKQEGVINLLSRYSYVYFVCEGKNEEAVLKWICNQKRLCIGSLSYSLEYCRSGRTQRGRKELVRSCLQLDYDGPVAIVYLCDSRTEEWNLGRNVMGDEIPVIKILTPPEIEILLILSNCDAEQEWKRRNRTNRQLKPSSFCQEFFRCDIKNGDNFINNFIDFQKFIESCREYKSRHPEQNCIYDLINCG